jgi:hypothetical protein
MTEVGSRSPAITSSGVLVGWVCGRTVWVVGC